MFTTQHRDFFSTFGYLHCPGLLDQDIGWIIEQSESLITELGIHHRPQHRTAVHVFFERRERLCSIIDLPQIVDLFTVLLGDQWNYYTSEANYYSGDTQWHADSAWRLGTCAKIALYLDPVTAASGALRVIPGSHRLHQDGAWDVHHAGQSHARWGVAGVDVPCVCLDSRPGDLVVFNTNIQHASFGGSCKRRMLAFQGWTTFTSEAHWQELDKHMNNWATDPPRPLHSVLLHSTGPASRQPHLQQVAARHEIHPRYRCRIDGSAVQPTMPGASPLPPATGGTG